MTRKSAGVNFAVSGFTGASGRAASNPANTRPWIPPPRTLPIGLPTVASLPAARPGHVLKMPEQLEETLYVKPYIYKFVLAKLGDPQLVAMDLDRQAFHKDLERMLGLRLVQVVNDYDPQHDNPTWKLKVVLEPRPEGAQELRLRRRNCTNSFLQARFLEEMHAMVVWFRLRLPHFTIRDALDLYRRKYGITEEDYAFQSMERLHRVFLQKHGMTTPRRSIPNLLHGK